MKLQGTYDGDLDQTPLELSKKEASQLRHFYNRSMLKKGWNLKWFALENQMKRFVQQLHQLHQLKNEPLCPPQRPLQVEHFDNHLKIVRSESFAKVTSLH